MKFYFLMFLLFCSIAAFGADANNTTVFRDRNSINPAHQKDALREHILQNLSKASSKLETLQSDISYLTIQDPDIVVSKTLQTGKLYYQKEDKRSKLRIRFDRLQQDDFPAEESVEDFYFDGVWLTKVDYKLEQVNLYQQAPENKPVDVFELINRRFPLFGLSETEKLEEDFIITVADDPTADPNDPYYLLLDVKEDSKYQNDYIKMEFWVDKNTFLPLRIKAFKTQGDIYDIRFLNIYINKKLKNGVFTIETPTGFRQNVEALETAQ